MRWTTWLIIWLAITLGGLGIPALLWLQGQPGVAQWVGLVANVFWYAWLIYGLFHWREVPWVRRVTGVLIGGVTAGLLAQFCYAMGWDGAAIAVTGAFLMALTFVVGLVLVRLLLSPGWPVFGVARTLVDEAIRMRIALVFIVALVLVLPALPLAMDPEELLRYRIQSFLTWSMMAMGGLLSLMTIFLAVGTVTREIQQRQIFLTMTKPVGRGTYLAGKWLGIALLNAVLVAVCGGGIYVFTMILADQPGQDAIDKAAVREQVLAARQSVSPTPPRGLDMNEIFQQRVEQLRERDPSRFGEPGSPLHTLPQDLRKQIQDELMRRWYTLGPREAQGYLFKGLTPAKQIAERVQLRLKAQPGGRARDGFVYLGVRVNGRPYYNPTVAPDFAPPEAGLVKLAENTYHVLDIPTRAINEDGELEVILYNTPLPGNVDQSTITFNITDGLQMLYRVGSFEPNFVRGLAIVWIQLGFLAMLGLAAGTFLSFPVACLGALLVYFAAAGSAYLTESLTSYAAFPDASLSVFDKIMWVPNQITAELGEGEIWGAVKIVIRLVGQGFLLLVPSFGYYNPRPMITEGLWVSPGLVADAALWVGVIWTGTVALVGWGIFHIRELARVTV